MYPLSRYCVQRKSFPSGFEIECLKKSMPYGWLDDTNGRELVRDVSSDST
jgi:hypothetical protein